MLGLVGKLVVEEFIEEDLGDDLELVPVVAESGVGADSLEIVDQRFGVGLKLECGHGVELRIRKLELRNLLKHRVRGGDLKVFPDGALLPVGRKAHVRQSIWRKGLQVCLQALWPVAAWLDDL